MTRSDRLDLFIRDRHIAGMTAQSKGKATRSGDRIAGRMADGVIILVPKVKPTNVTIGEMRNVFRSIKREASSGRFVEKVVEKPFRK